MTSGLGGMSCAQAKAAVICGCVGVIGNLVQYGWSAIAGCADSLAQRRLPSRERDVAFPVVTTACHGLRWRACAFGI